MNLNDLSRFTVNSESTGPMPALFIGHGSPMNAIEVNSFSKTWSEIGKTLPKPVAILCISAHWETNGTFVTMLEHPPAIHDFYGFPESLFTVEYPAPGSPQLASEIIETIQEPRIKEDVNWGFDHGTWSILRWMYPEANIPVVQLSLDHTMKPEDHYLLARQLRNLRKKGILLIGSGNMVHNLRQIDWRNPDHGRDWAEEANEKFKQLILSGDFMKLTHYDQLGQAVKLSVPTPEHFLPLLYVLAQKEEQDKITFFNDQCVYGSLSMTSVKIIS